MIRVFKIEKNIPTNADYVIDKVEDFFALLPYLRKKLSGVWKVILIEPSMQSTREILSMSISECIDIDIYLEPNAYTTFQLEHPNMIVEIKTTYQRFHDYIATLDKLFEPKAVEMIYKRIGSNLDQLKDAANKCVSECKGETVTTKIVATFVQASDIVYPKQILQLFLLHKQPFRWKQLEKFIIEMGEDRAFYVLKKHFTNLYHDKVAFVNGKLEPDYMLTSIDINATLRAYYMFNMATCSKQLIPIMACIDEGSLLLEDDDNLQILKRSVV